MLKPINARRRLLRKNIYKSINHRRRLERQAPAKYAPAKRFNKPDRINYDIIEKRRKPVRNNKTGYKMAYRYKDVKSNKREKTGYKMAYRYRYYNINESVYDNMEESNKDSS